MNEQKKKPSEAKKPKKKQRPKLKWSDMPFRILGVDDYGRAFFIGTNDRMWAFGLQSITKNHLLTLADLDFWRMYYGDRNHVYWEEAINFIIQSAGRFDFNPFVIRGRGAWSEPDGRICYHDGEKTIGEYSKDFIYIRKTKKDIGLDEKPANPEELQEIEELNRALTYETDMDAIRLLAWSTISPFAGALPWRPALLLTGHSGSGKTQILDLVSKPISNAEVFTGGETTEPGVRQIIGNDSVAITIEEAEGKSKKQAINREALFSMMRASASNDAPKVAKGSKGGEGVAFAMRSMFMFMAIDPTVENVADENRIFRVNLVKADLKARQNYKQIYKPRLQQLLTHKKCRQIRSLVWRELPTILKRAGAFADVIEEISGKDSRFSLAEGLLQATYWHIWRNKRKMAVKDVSGSIEELYSSCPPDGNRDESEEMLDRILDQKILIEQPDREQITIREAIHAIRFKKFDVSNPEKIYDDLDMNVITHLRAMCGRNGVGMREDDLAIDMSSFAIMNMIEMPRGYHRVLQRNKDLLEKSAPVRLAGKTRRCVILKLEGDAPPPRPEQKEMW